jgi:polyhydroxybutyrate depolymerase
MKHSILVFLMLGIIIITNSCKKDNSLVTEADQDEQNSTTDQIIKGNFDFEDISRNYMVFLPKNYSGKTNFPLVINLHAYSYNAQMEMEYTKMNLVADTAGFIIVYPNGKNNWNSGIGVNPSYPTPNYNDVGFINALIDTLIKHYPNIDLDRIYACGFSNGGIMAYKLACQLSNRIAAVASVSGVMAESFANNCNTPRALPVLHIHGTKDNIAPLDGVTGCYSVDQTLNFWSDANSCGSASAVLLPDLIPTDGCTVEKTTYSDSSNECKVVFYKVIDGGHSWPGAVENYSWSGKTNMDINASAEIWKFFKNYKRKL